MPASQSRPVSASPLHVAREVRPAWFAAVMATGIVARAVAPDQPSALSRALLAIGLIALVLLSALTVVRLGWYRAEALADARSPARGFTYLAVVAAFGVMATGVARLDRGGAALALLVIAAILWILLCYAVPGLLMVHHGGKPGVIAADGTWFLWIVGTQSLAVAASALPPPWGDRLAVAAVLVLSVGVVLYLLVAALVVGRLFAESLTAADLAPAYWVFMGATAISVLAAAQLERRLSVPLIGMLHSVLAGVAVALWAFGTWLIPLLLAGGVWRYVFQHFRSGPDAFDPGIWSVVFPIGMYGVATHELGRGVDQQWMVDFGGVVGWIGFAAWLVVAVATVGRALRCG